MEQTPRCWAGCGPRPRAGGAVPSRARASCRRAGCVHRVQAELQHWVPALLPLPLLPQRAENKQSLWIPVPPAAELCPAPPSAGLQLASGMRGMWDPAHVWQRQGTPGSRPGAVLWAAYGSSGPGCWSPAQRKPAGLLGPGTSSGDRSRAGRSTGVRGSSAGPAWPRLVTMEDAACAVPMTQTLFARADRCCASRAAQTHAAPLQARQQLSWLWQQQLMAGSGGQGRSVGCQLGRG